MHITFLTILILKPKKTNTFFNKFCTKTPILPIYFYFDHAKTSNDYLKGILTNTSIHKTIFIHSPKLSLTIGEWFLEEITNSKKIDLIRCLFLKYFYKISTSPSRFGVFVEYQILKFEKPSAFKLKVLSRQNWFNMNFFALKSNKTIPLKLKNVHNYDRLKSLLIYKLLFDIQGLNLMGRIVLHWRDFFLKNHLLKVTKCREHLLICKCVSLKDEDKILVTHLENKESIMIWLKIVKNSTKFILEEFLFTNESIVKNNHNNANQLKNMEVNKKNSPIFQLFIF